MGGIVFYLLDLIIVCIILFFAPFFIVVCLKPKDLREKYEVLSSIEIESETRRTVGERIYKDLLALQDKAHQTFSSSSQSYVNGLEKFIDFTIRGFLRKAKYSVHASRIRRLLCVLCVLILSLLGCLFGVVFGGIILIFFLVKIVFFSIYLSAGISVFGFLWAKLTNKLNPDTTTNNNERPPAPPNLCRRILALLVFVDSNLALLTACSVVSSSCYIVIKVFGYTLMGLILNADIATPYAVFLLVVVTNVYLCYANLQKKYRKAKKIISKEWTKNIGLLRDQRHLTNNSDDTIPRELFWFVCGKDLNAEYTILPIQTQVFFMFRNMICILAFLFLSLSTVIFFSDLYHISTLASSIAVFISGVIPKMFLQGFTKRKTFGGWEKIKITRQTEDAVKKYIEYENNGTRPQPVAEELTHGNRMERIRPDCE